jgi:hypothetical protein
VILQITIAVEHIDNGKDNIEQVFKELEDEFLRKEVEAQDSACRYPVRGT